MVTRLSIHKCDEGALVFDAKRGNTSLVSQSGYHLLLTLNDESRMQLTNLKEVLAMPGTTDSQAFEDLITSLEDSGLIERC